MNASDLILKKALLTSPMTSKEWEGVRAGIKDRAFFSARVEEARILAEARKACSEIAEGNLSASEARRNIRRILSAVGHPETDNPAESLRNLSSKTRLNLILEQNVRSARGYVQWKNGTTDGALAAFPAQELVRLYTAKKPRDWVERWSQAGGKLFGGRMIALKSDPIWTRISRFGHPWPPFDFGSKMGVEDVSRSESIRLGLLSEDSPPPKLQEERGLNDGLESALPPGQNRDFVEDYLRERFGSQIRVHRGMIKFNSDLIGEMLEGRGGSYAVLGRGKYNPQLLEKISDPTLRALVSERSLTITPQWIKSHGTKHMNPSGDGGLNLPMTKEDYELIPALWRNPDRVEKDVSGRLSLVLDTMDGGVLRLGFLIMEGQPTTFRKEKKQT